MKNSFLILLFLILTVYSKAQSTVGLFNGKDLDGWNIDVPDMDNNPNAMSPFIIRNGLFVSLGNPEGHIITDAVYKDFRLDIEYRFTKEPGNCGVLAYVSTPRALYKMFPKSIKVQLMHENAGDFGV